MVQRDNVTVAAHSQPVVAHSSYDAEMQAAHMAIEYIKESVVGKVVIFIDNQSTLWLHFNVKPHLLFEIVHQNSIDLGNWLSLLPDNEVKFRWMLSHLGFSINELADKAADVTPIGPFPFPTPTIASRIRANRAFIVHKWCQS